LTGTAVSILPDWRFPKGGLFRMDSISYWLDFPYEVTKRYQKMLRENPDLTDMIYVYLLEGGTDLHSSLSDEEFRALIQRQYDEVMDGVY
jgi:hypothetical protein